MKKLLIKDKKIRQKIKLINKKKFILKAISKNSNFFNLTRWNAFFNLKFIINHKNSNISTSNRCIQSINKKRLNKMTTFSRHIFLKLIRSGSVNGINKSSW